MCLRQLHNTKKLLFAESQLVVTAAALLLRILLRLHNYNLVRLGFLLYSRNTLHENLTHTLWPLIILLDL